MPRDGLTARYSAVVSRLFESSPLRKRAFRLFYFGSVGAALGYTMQATIAAWLMATLTPSEFMVALVQTASTAPTLLFGLFAGTLADIVDRRRLILVTQIGLLVATLLLGIAALAGVIGPASLLLLTFIVGTGFTFYLPAQQASIYELVPRAELPRAVAGALWLPRHLQRRTLNVVTLSGVGLWTAAVLLVAATRYTAIALVGALGCGMAWVSVFASLSAGTQSTAPAWVRARAVSMNLVAVQASIAIGSALWGALASAAGVRISLAVSAGALVLLHVLNRRVVVAMGKEADVMPGAQLPELTISGEPLPD